MAFVRAGRRRRYWPGNLLPQQNPPSNASSPQSQVKTVGLLIKSDGKSETCSLGELASRANELCELREVRKIQVKSVSANLPLLLIPRTPASACDRIVRAVSSLHAMADSPGHTATENIRDSSASA